MEVSEWYKFVMLLLYLSNFIVYSKRVVRFGVVFSIYQSLRL